MPEPACKSWPPLGSRCQLCCKLCSFARLTLPPRLRLAMPAVPFGTANISINEAAKQAINGSWAGLLPDSILINHMPTEYVAVLPARAVQLGYSNWEGPPYSFVDLYAIGPFDNVLAIKVGAKKLHPSICGSRGLASREDCPGGITLAAHAESRDAWLIGSRRLPSINTAASRPNPLSTAGPPRGHRRSSRPQHHAIVHEARRRPDCAGRADAQDP